MGGVEVERSHRNGNSKRSDNERRFSEHRTERKRRSRSRSRSPRGRSRDKDRERSRRRSKERDRDREDRHSRKRYHESERSHDSSSKRTFRESKEDKKPDTKADAFSYHNIRQAVLRKAEEVKSTLRPGQEPTFKTEALKPEQALVYADYHMDKAEKAFAKLEQLKKANAEFMKKLPKLDGTLPAEPEPEPEKPKMQLDLKPELPQLSVTDPRVSLRSANRPRKRGFQFVEQGQYSKQAQIERAQAKLAQLQNNVSKVAKNTGISAAVKMAIATPSGAEAHDDLPDIEWWDKVLLDDGNYDSVPSKDIACDQRYGNKITDLIEHPVQLKPPDAALNNVPIKAHLTKKEMKKLRRMNRKEVQREETEKIRLGLKKAPEPKVKMANLMRVLGNDAIQDPTKMENYVRDQVAERLKKHEQSNLDRKLTKEQKGDKKRRKIMEDTSIQVYVAVYKILSLANAKKRFKVEANANQLQMTGIIVSVDGMNVVVVEGGPKQQKFYKNLLLNRIKWSEEMVGQRRGVANEDEEGQRNECTLIWEGVVPSRNFSDPPQIIRATDHKSARDVFLKHGVPHYWDHCFSQSVLLDSAE
ncbi:unnamed protein product [Bursaphelenchus xylophilus]|uniref:(pine wood nematode) hypothetical protein n=1 Tax=Bursaphelenchus xylophilus TaxID=6326 RepID=A0A1I7RJB6_BURXY|nr:unnamed protein product [Bursaphelenchus xylophilus]CAG9128767.1 unnamed protein product [Bursaphelenchus xylophilus]